MALKLYRGHQLYPFQNREPYRAVPAQVPLLSDYATKIWGGLSKYYHAPRYAAYISHFTPTILFYKSCKGSNCLLIWQAKILLTVNLLIKTRCEKNFLTWWLALIFLLHPHAYSLWLRFCNKRLRLKMPNGILLSCHPFLW